MKKFKFSLEGLLKIRKLKELECKTEVGRIQIEIENIQGQIAKHDQGITDIYNSQEVLLKDGVTGRELKFFPYFFEGKSAHIDQLNEELKLKQEELTEKMEELAQKRADLKVIANMKDKRKSEHKKESLKKELQSIEEQAQNWTIAKKAR